MARKDQEYTLGIFHGATRHYTSAPDGTLQEQPITFPIRRVTSHWGPFTFSQKTDFDVQVGEWDGLLGRWTTVVDSHGNPPNSSYQDRWNPEKQRTEAVGIPDNRSKKYSGLLSGGALPFGLPLFSRRASARAAVRQLVTVTDQTKQDGVTRQRPGFPRTR